MEAVIKLPIGICNLPVFRQLAAALDPARALLVWYIIFEEFFYRAQDGNPPGRLPRADVPFFLKSLTPVPEEGRQQFFDDVLVSATKFLKPDGDDYLCPRFLQSYTNVGSVRSREQRGGDLRWFQEKAKLARSQAAQLSFLIASEKFVDETGAPIAAELVNRITWIIKVCDNALFKPERPIPGFSESVIQSALGVVRQYTDEQLLQACRRIALNRESAALAGMTTEKLLPRFVEYAQQFEP